jgi:hypothetical protein
MEWYLYRMEKNARTKHYFNRMELQYISILLMCEAYQVFVHGKFI